MCGDNIIILTCAQDHYMVNVTGTEWIEYLTSKLIYILINSVITTMWRDRTVPRRAKRSTRLCALVLYGWLHEDACTWDPHISPKRAAIGPWVIADRHAGGTHNNSFYRPADSHMDSFFAFFFLGYTRLFLLHDLAELYSRTRDGVASLSAGEVGRRGITPAR